MGLKSWVKLQLEIICIVDKFTIVCRVKNAVYSCKNWKSPGGMVSFEMIRENKEVLIHRNFDAPSLFYYLWRLLVTFLSWIQLNILSENKRKFKSWYLSLQLTDLDIVSSAGNFSSANWCTYKDKKLKIGQINGWIDLSIC